MLDYWMDMGVDGFRLDAIPYLYEREGTNCENLPETHAFLKKLRRHVDEKYPHRLLLAEANQWPEDAVAYFGGGDGAECHMCFHFPVMPRLFMAIQMEDRHPIVDILQQTPAIPESAQWALFLRNHDELTLEMVTEDDRDYMYRVYAQDPQARINLGIRRRLAPLMQNNRPKIELMNGLLLSLPGTPVLYYGDEIGMGDNIYLGDRNGVRTPMQWSSDRNAGFSTANPQRLYLPVVIDPEYHFEAVNVEAQQNNVHSLLWWTKRLLDLRKRHQAFGRGGLDILSSDNPKTLAFLRRWDDERILVVANLSRFAQCTWIDLSEHRGLAPVEMLGRTRFPLIGDGAYCLTLGPYAFYWFQLAAHAPESAAPPTLTVAGAGPADWANVFRGKARIALEEALPAYLQGRPWFQGRFRALTSVAVRDAIAVPRPGGAVRIALVQAEYAEGDPEQYVVPLDFAAGEPPPGAVVAARLRVAPRGDGESVSGALYDPFGQRVFVSELLDAAIWGGRFEGESGDLNGRPTPASAQTPPEGPGADDPPALHEGDNTTAALDGRALLKVYRRVEEGPHPEVEMLRFLAAHSALKQTPALLGVLEYQPESGPSITTGMAQEYIAGEADAWRLTLDALRRFFEHALTGAVALPEVETGPRNIVDLSEGDIPDQAREMLGAYLETARLMARRTAELHVALASDPADPAFAPEPFTPMYQRSLYQSMRGQVRLAVERLRRRRDDLPEALREPADRVLQGEEALLRQARRVLDRDHGGAHPLSRRLPAQAPGVDRPRLPGGRFRRRAGSAAESPPPQTFAGARPDQSASVAPGRRGGRARRGRPPRRGRADPAAVGALLAALGVGRLPERVPGRAGDGRAAAARPDGAAVAVRLLPAGLERLRAAPGAGPAVGESRFGHPECAANARTDLTPAGAGTGRNLPAGAKTSDARPDPLHRRRTAMIIVLRPDSTDEHIDHILERIRELGFKPHVSRARRRTHHRRHRRRGQAPGRAVAGHPRRRAGAADPQAVQAGQPRVPLRGHRGRGRRPRREDRAHRRRPSRPDRRPLRRRGRGDPRRHRRPGQGGGGQPPARRGVQAAHQPVQLPGTRRGGVAASSATSATSTACRSSPR